MGVKIRWFSGLGDRITQLSKEYGLKLNQAGYVIHFSLGEETNELKSCRVALFQQS